MSSSSALEARTDEGPRQGEDRRFGRAAPARRRVRGRPRRRLGSGRARAAHRRLRGPAHPLGDQGHARAHGEGHEAQGHRPRRASASTTSTCPPRPSAASSSPTRRSPTSSRPPSTRWRCCWRWPATSRRRTPRWSTGRWDRSKYSGVEVMDKTLGILGFGRIGQLVAQRAKGFDMKVVAYDPFVGAERYRDLGVEKAESSDDVYAVADFITVHLPKTPETAGWLDAEAFAKMKDGVRILNVARGPLINDDDLKAALDSGKVAGAALDVFPSEPITDYPLFGYPNVVVTPHLGASTAEATDRAGYQAAEQVIAALKGESGQHRGEHSVDPQRGHGGPRPVPAAVPVARQAGDGPRRRVVRRPVRGRVPRPHRRARRSPAGHQRPAGRPERTHRGGPQRGQRPGHRQGARHRGRRDDESARPRLHRPRAGDRRGRATSARGSSARRSATRTARICSRRGTSGSTCSSRATSRCCTTATCRA